MIKLATYIALIGHILMFVTACDSLANYISFSGRLYNSSSITALLVFGVVLLDVDRGFDAVLQGGQSIRH